MPKFLPALLLGIAAVAQLQAAEGIRDPEFDKVPFDQWFGPSGQAQWKWTERTLPVLLSVHQRLMTRLQILFDGAEAAKRKGQGELYFMFQIVDSSGRIYQDHTPYDLAKVEGGMKFQDLSITESVFVLPGDYSVSMAVYDTATKEHSVKKTKLHIAPPKLDPLPDAWEKLPSIEFVGRSDPPDRWFLPQETGTLNLPVGLARPAVVDVLLNLTPTEEHPRNYGIQDRNLSIMIPMLKVISAMAAPTLSLNMSLVDLSRHRVAYRAGGIHNLDWDKIKAVLPQSNSASIDVKSLADRRHNGAFLGSEIEKSFSQGHTVIVLSGPMVFETGQELPEPFVKSCHGCRLFYIRTQVPAARAVTPDLGRRRGPSWVPGSPGRMRMPGGEEPQFTTQMDQLVPLLKPLEPHVFDIASPEQFRKALATLIAEMAAL